MSDVGAPAKGPGLPQRIPEAPPPPVRVKIEHGKNVEVAIKLYDEILRRVPGAILERTEGLDDCRLINCRRESHFCTCIFAVWQRVGNQGKV